MTVISSFLCLMSSGGLAVALAAPERVIVASALPATVKESYAEFAQERGQTGLEAIPACRFWTEQLSLCFSLIEGGQRRMLTLGDLDRWQLNIVEAEAEALAHARAHISPSRFQPQVVEGMPGRYWLSVKRDGYDTAALLLPELLAEVAGGRPVVAVPSRDTLILWRPGDPEFDKVVAVGVRRFYDMADQPISPVLYQWSRDGWTVWGQATPGGASTRPASPSQ